MRRLLLLGLFLISSCSLGEEVYQEPMRVVIPEEAVTVSFGELEDASGLQILTTAWVAALSETGRFLAVGDRADPFLRVLDRSSNAVTRFGEKGGGPGELRSAYAVDFLGDSIVLVLNGGSRLERFRPSGEWVSGHPLSGTGLLVFSVATACGGEVFAFGVPSGHRGLDTIPWVHELLFSSGIEAAERLSIPGKGYRIGWGGLNGFDGNDDGVLLWQKSTRPQVGFWVPCDGAPPRLWSHGGSERTVERTLAASDGHPGGSVLTLPDTLFGGAAAKGTTMIFARNPRDAVEGGRSTIFHVVRDSECLEVNIVGRWTLHDAHQDGLVLATNDPFPEVRVVDWAWFEDTLRRVPCRG
jgi:hypothetical protein